MREGCFDRRRFGVFECASKNEGFHCEAKWFQLRCIVLNCLGRWRRSVSSSRTYVHLSRCYDAMYDRAPVFSSRFKLLRTICMLRRSFHPLWSLIGRFLLLCAKFRSKVQFRWYNWSIFRRVFSFSNKWCYTFYWSYMFLMTTVSYVSVHETGALRVIHFFLCHELFIHALHRCIWTFLNDHLKCIRNRTSLISLSTFGLNLILNNEQ